MSMVHPYFPINFRVLWLRISQIFHVLTLFLKVQIPHVAYLGHLVMTRLLTLFIYRVTEP